MQSPATSSSVHSTALQKICGPGNYLAGDTERAAPYLRDELSRYQGSAMLVAQPRDTVTVAALLGYCNEHRIAVTPQGGNTSYAGAATPAAVLVNNVGSDDATVSQSPHVLLRLDNMNHVHNVDVHNATITAEAGCTLAAVRESARAHGLCFPLSLGSQSACTIGGVLSTNAGGLRVLRYGNARELCLGLEVVLADGQVLSQLNRVRKNNTGYDLKQLFIGAEGTLGIITTAVLRLFPEAVYRTVTVACVADTQAALSVFERCRATLGARLSAFEFMDGRCLQSVLAFVPDVSDPFARPSPAVSSSPPSPSPDYSPRPPCVLIETEDFAPQDDSDKQLTQLLARCHKDGWLQDAVVATSEAQVRALWRLREAIPQAQKRAGLTLKHDIAVPLSSLDAFMQEAHQVVAQHCKEVSQEVSKKVSEDGEQPGAPIKVAADTELATEAVVESFGHFGDGNIHFNVRLSPAMTDTKAPPDDACKAHRDTRWSSAHAKTLSSKLYDLVVAHGGSFSAEHGIGQLRKDDLCKYQPAPALALMRCIKRTLDVNCIMNPGKVIDP